MGFPGGPSCCNFIFFVRERGESARVSWEKRTTRRVDMRERDIKTIKNLF